MWVEMATWLVGDGQQPRQRADGAEPEISRGSGLHDTRVLIHCEAVEPVHGALADAAASTERGPVRLPVTVCHREPGLATLDHDGITIGALWGDHNQDITDFLPAVGQSCVVVGTVSVMADHEEAVWFFHVLQTLTSDWLVRDIRAEFRNPAESVVLGRIHPGIDGWASNHGHPAGRSRTPQPPRHGHVAVEFGWFSHTAPYLDRHARFWLELVAERSSPGHRPTGARLLEA